MTTGRAPPPDSIHMCDAAPMCAGECSILSFKLKGEMIDDHRAADRWENEGGSQFVVQGIGYGYLAGIG